MQLARVIGTVVATLKAPNMEGVRLLIVQPLTRRLEPIGQPVVAADALETAGPGELVYIVGAREAAEALPNRFVPVDHAIVGIADAVEVLVGAEGAGGSVGAGRSGDRRRPAGDPAELAQAGEPGRSRKPRKPRESGR
jgi:ethanolamine utilization protein EutN